MKLIITIFKETYFLLNLVLLLIHWVVKSIWFFYHGDSHFVSGVPPSPYINGVMTM